MRGLSARVAQREIVDCARTLRRITGSQGHWFRASGTQHTTPTIRAAAAAAGRPMPRLSARVRVQFDGAKEPSYAMRGSADEIAAEVRAFAALGVEHLALNFGTTEPAEVVARAERFAGEVAPLV
jgi:hypothetical protein